MASRSTAKPATAIRAIQKKNIRACTIHVTIMNTTSAAMIRKIIRPMLLRYGQTGVFALLGPRGWRRRSRPGHCRPGEDVTGDEHDPDGETAHLCGSFRLMDVTTVFAGAYSAHTHQAERHPGARAGFPSPRGSRSPREVPEPAGSRGPRKCLGLGWPGRQAGADPVQHLSERPECRARPAPHAASAAQDGRGRVAADPARV